MSPFPKFLKKNGPAVVCAALVGCTAVTRVTSSSAIYAAAPALQRDGSATLASRDIDDVPRVDPDDPDATEQIRLDQRIGVRLAAPYGAPVGRGPEQTMTIADLLADCPPGAGIGAMRLYPRCKLFRANEVRLRHGYRADVAEIVVGASFVAGGAALTCALACGGTAERRASGVVFGVGIIVGVVALVRHALDAIADSDYKH